MKKSPVAHPGSALCQSTQRPASNRSDTVGKTPVVGARDRGGNPGHWWSGDI